MIATRKKVFSNSISLFIVFLVFSFLRFYNLEKRLSFGWDQEQFSYQIREIIINHKLTLLGPRVNNDLGFFLAPYFTYLLLPFYLFTNLHPNALLIFIVLFNVIFFVLSYLILKKIFGFKKTLFFLSFWSINYLLADYDVVPWWPVTIPLGVIIIWLILFQIYKRKNNSYWFLLGGITLGFFSNMHFQFVFIVFFSFIFFIFWQIKIKKINLKNWLLLIFGFILMFLPLVIFDFKHNFLNLKLFINFFFDKEKIVKDINIWWSIFGNFLNPILNYKKVFDSQLPIKFFYFLTLIILVYLIKSKGGFLKNFYQASLILWITFPLVFMFYGQRPSEYYFVFLYPFIYIVFLDFFISIKKTFVLIFFLIFFSFITQKQIKKNLIGDYFSLYYKNKAIHKLKILTKGKKFNVSFSTDLGRNHGFRYLIDYYQIKQTGDFKDPLVEIRIPAKNHDIKIGQMIGLKIPKELK